jgi:hypothetical protein
LPKKPFTIVLFSIIYFLSPAFILAQAAIMANLPLIGRISIVQRLAPLDWAVLALYLACAASIFSVKRWGWYAFMLASLALVADNAYVAFLRHDRYGVFLVLAYDLVLTLAAGFFFRRKVIAPYFNPRMRWWETQPRYQALSYLLLGSGESRFSANIVDISASGCFILSDRELRVGEVLPAEIHCFGEDIALDVHVVRAADYHGSRGYGLMFVKAGEISSRALAGLTRRLHKAGLSHPRWEGSGGQKGGTAVRYGTENEASIEVGGKAYWASLVDLSRKGCLLMANCDPPLGERHPIVLRCMKEELALEGVVRWKIAGGRARLIGLAFSFGERGKAARVSGLVGKLKRTGALERSRQNAALDEKDILEYALNSPYKVLWKLSRLFAR